MGELSEATRLAVLVRHAITPVNKARYEGRPDNLVQGLSPDMPIDAPEGVIQSHAFGIAFGRFAVRNNIQVVSVHAADTRRAKTTRDLALTHTPNLTIVPPTLQLGELQKGSFEGRRRNEVYPEAVKQQADDDWDFRHGEETPTRKAQTPREAGEQWLRWFQETKERPDFQPRTDPTQPLPTILVFGHNLITACGITLLTHKGEAELPPVSDRTYKVNNATGLLLAEHANLWSVPGRIVPTAADFEQARAIVTR